MKNLKDLIPVEDHGIAKSLLRDARKKLNPHEGEFVCCNLTSSADTWEEKRIAGILRDEISRRLEGRSTVCGWLREVIGIQNLLADGGKNMVKYRQRWVDSMIAEFQ